MTQWPKLPNPSATERGGVTSIISPWGVGTVIGGEFGI